MPQDELLKLLEGIGDGSIGMDCSVIPSKRYPEFKMVSTTDFFFPLVEDPYVQGRVACANVISDMYALGVQHIDNVLMILAASNAMPIDQRHIVTRRMIEGFNDLALEAGTKVTGGQTVLNPWPIIGGVAQSMCRDDDIIMPQDGQPGDVLVLTKPLGTQVAVNLREWFHQDKDANKALATKAKALISVAQADRAFAISVGSMCQLNRTGAKLMHKYGARGATDVTGFGIQGHAANLAENQKAKVDLVVHTLPVIAGMTKVADEFAFFNLRQGRSAETSGGLLAIVPRQHAQAFCDEIQREDGWPAWIVGHVRESSGESNQGIVLEDAKIIEV